MSKRFQTWRAPVAALLVFLLSVTAVFGADTSITLLRGDGTPVPVKYHDNGDGTYSETSYGAGTGGGVRASLCAKTTTECDTILTAVNGGQLVVTAKNTAGLERALDASGNGVVVGNVAAAATDSGSPVKTGGVYNATPPTYTNTQRGDTQLDTRGNTKTAMCAVDTTTCAATGSSGSDGNTTSTVGILTRGYPYTYNGTTWDRQRSDGTTGGLGVGGTVASAATDSGNPVKVGGKYNSSPVNLTNGQRGDIQLGQSGQLFVSAARNSDATGAVYADGSSNTAGAYLGNTQTFGMGFNGTTWDRQRVDANKNLMVSPAGNSFVAISTAATTAVKASAGKLHTLTVTGGTAGAITCYDNTTASGTKIADFDSTNAMATYTLDVAFGTGLTCVTGAATKVTVSFS